MALSGKNLARIGAAAGAATLAWNYVDDKYNISGDIEVSGRGPLAGAGPWRAWAARGRRPIPGANCSPAGY
jgi:hypothetical protein